MKIQLWSENSTKILIGEQHQNNWEIACEWKKQTLVLVSQRTSSCLTRKERAPATRLPKHHGTQWQPGSRTSSYFPKTSLMATLECFTWKQPYTCPIFTTATHKHQHKISASIGFILLNTHKNDNKKKNVSSYFPIIFLFSKEKIKAFCVWFSNTNHKDSELNLQFEIFERERVRKVGEIYGVGFFLKIEYGVKNLYYWHTLIWSIY